MLWFAILSSSSFILLFFVRTVNFLERKMNADFSQKLEEIRQGQVISWILGIKNIGDEIVKSFSMVLEELAD